ncbi:MAG: OsmC family protein [Microcystaceae cyanobacterium]
MTTTSLTSTANLNGIDIDGLNKTVKAIQQEPAQGITKFKVKSTWQGQTVSETKTETITLGEEEIKRDFTFRADEPLELLGTNHYPNPQEYLMGALNACMIVGYVAGAALNGVKLEKLEIESQGQLDLRGFLAIDDQIPPGYENLSYTVHIKGDGTPEQFQKIHEFVQKTSPNYYNLANAISLNAQLIVE